jgi:urease accessory protein UreH
MIYRTALVAVLLTLTATGCTDRYRDPCEAAAPTTTTIRTKNKALGWVPPSTIFYQSPAAPSGFSRIIEKCA